MTAWELALQVEPRGGQPRFLEIARTIAEDVRRGRLRAGDVLPSSRALARQVGVHRNTVLAAYEELHAQGWIMSERGRGTFVSWALPQEPAERPARPVGRGQACQAGFDLPLATVPELPPARRPGLLLLLGGVPELRLLPQLDLGRAYRRALAGVQGARLADYGGPQGDPRLRAALADLLSRTRGVPASAESVAVTRGGQEAMYLAARTLLRPGDVVAVESLGYRLMWEALRLTGARLCPVPVDAEGLDVTALERLCASTRVRAVYLTPHHQCPTTVTMPAARRLQLLELARRQRMIVFEDDYDHDFQYDGRPVLPIASHDDAGNVIYIGTLSKLLAPGLRLGYLAATPDVVQQVAAYRLYVDRQGDHVLERAVATLLEDGAVQRHARRLRRIYRTRRDAFCDMLRRELPQLKFAQPRGGMAVWAAAPGVDVDAWAQRALAAGVAFQTARTFAFDGAPLGYVRLGFAACDEGELREATERLAATLRA